MTRTVWQVYKNMDMVMKGRILEKHRHFVHKGQLCRKLGKICASKAYTFSKSILWFYRFIYIELQRDNHLYDLCGFCWLRTFQSCTSLERIKRRIAGLTPF